MLKYVAGILVAIVCVGCLGLQFLGIVDFSKLIGGAVGETSTYLGIGFSNDLTTGSPSVSTFTPYVTVEQYKTKYFNVLNPSDKLGNSYKYNWANSTIDKFAEKLGQYGVSLQVTKTVQVYINETTEMVFSKTFEFMGGIGRKLEIWFSENVVSDGVVLKIVILWQIHLSIESVAYSWQKSITKIVYTARTSSEITENNPVIILQGTLVEKPNPGYLTVQVVVLEANKLSVQYISRKIDVQSSQTVSIYLTKNGNYVNNAQELGTFVIGDFVDVTGKLQKKDNVWVCEIVNIGK